MNTPTAPAISVKADGSAARPSAFPVWPNAALTAAAVAAWWLPRLFRGFWTDETGAYWIAAGGLKGVWDRLHVFFPGQSLIYSYLSTFFVVDGPYRK